MSEVLDECEELSASIHGQLMAITEDWKAINSVDQDRPAVIKGIPLRDEITVSLKQGTTKQSAAALEHAGISIDPSDVFTLHFSSHGKAFERYAVTRSVVVDVGYNEALDAVKLCDLETDLAVIEEHFAKANPRPSLDHIRDRRQAMRRCIGPLAIGYTLDAVQTPLPSDAQAICDVIARTNKYGDKLVSLAHKWANHPRDFTGVTPAVATLAAIMRTAVESHDNRFTDTITDVQENVFERFTYDQHFTGTNEGTVGLQPNISATIALPAYLASKYGLQDRASLLDKFNSMSLEEICQIMEEDDFIEGLHALTIARNGTLAEVVHGEDVADKRVGQLDYERLFEPGVSRMEPIETMFAPALTLEAKTLPQLRGIPWAFDSYNLFVQSDGKTVINPDFIVAARAGIRLGNQHKPSDLYPTTGCPAAMNSTRIRSGDLTPQQVELLADLGAKFDGERITFPRSAITELHKVHLAALRKFISTSAS